ncbi:phosphopantetheine-binding protein [Amycolatopsis sp. NPDC059090]|uniref:phosphopantetheine-binding protein n=1 Tax=unclassified Amycolatopsis TaxID=2618356 RepID=UPI00366EF8E6
MDEQFEALVRPHLPLLPPGAELGANDRLFDFGLDSLGVVNLLASLEKAYRVRFTHDAMNMSTFETLGTLWTALSALLTTASPESNDETGASSRR